eukprot:g572.t1
MSCCVCIVTGASRGIGRGIALVLARDAGCVVYATARSLDALESLKEEVVRGGKNAGEASGELIPAVVDHTDDAAMTAFVERVVQERGSMQLLVNNAYGGVGPLTEHFGEAFFEKPIAIWDASHIVGLRSHYVMSVLAARHMVKRGDGGLIVNVSSGGGLSYLFDTAYGCGKAALDRLGADMAEELEDHGVHVVTLWPGAVRTETTDFPNAESVELAGRCVAALVRQATSAQLNQMNGKVVQTAELGLLFGFTDVDGNLPGRSMQRRLRVEMASPPVQWTYEPSAKL